MANEKDTSPSDTEGTDTPSVPEVEAEIVNQKPPADPTEGSIDDHQEETDPKDQAEETLTSASEKKSSALTPGVFLFVGFVVLVLTAFAFWQLQSGSSQNSINVSDIPQEEISESIVSETKTEEASEQPEPIAAPESPSATPPSGLDQEPLDDATSAGRNTADVQEPADADSNADQTASSVVADDLDQTTTDANPFLERDGVEILEEPRETPQTFEITKEDNNLTSHTLDNDEVSALENETATETAQETEGPSVQGDEIGVEESSLASQPNRLTASASEVDALRKILRGDIDDLKAALDAERRKTDALQTELATIKQDFAQALSERDAQARQKEAALSQTLQRLENIDVGKAKQLATGAAVMRALAGAIETGAPFQKEAQALSEIAPNAPGLDQLMALAPNGAPTMSALKASFDIAAREGLAAAGREENDGWSAGLMQRAQSLVSIRPADPREGQTPRFIISRAEAALEKGAIDAALSEIATLPEAAQTTMQPWIKQARLRADIDQALQDLNDYFETLAAE